MAKLYFDDSDGRNSWIAIGVEQPEVVIGRRKDCLIRTNNSTVSRKHCVVRFEAGQYRVKDQNSSNGTFYGEERIDQVDLADGDVFRCGNFEIRFELDDHERVAARRSKLPPKRPVPPAASGGAAPPPAPAPAPALAASPDRRPAPAAASPAAVSPAGVSPGAGTNGAAPGVPAAPAPGPELKASMHPADGHPADGHPADVHPADGHPADVHPADLDALRDELGQERKRVEELDEQVKLDTAAISEWKSKARELEDQLDLRRIEIDSLNSALEDLRASEESTEKLTGRISTLEGERDGALSRISELEAANEELERFRETSRARGLDAKRAEDRADDAETERDRIATERDELLELLKAARHELEDARSAAPVESDLPSTEEVDELRLRADTADAAVAAAEAARDDALGALERMRVELDSASESTNKAVAAAEAEAEQAKTAAGEALAEAESAAASVDEAKARIAELEVALDSAQAQAASGESAADEIQGLTSKLESANLELSDLRAELAKANVELDAAQSELQSQTTRAGEMESAVEAAKLAQTEAESARDAAQAELETTKASAEALAASSTESEAQQARVAELSTELEALRTELDAATQAAAAAAKELDARQAEMESATKRAQDLQSTLETAQNRAEQLEGELLEARADAEAGTTADATELEAELQLLRDEHVRMKASHRAITIRQRDLIQQLNQAKAAPAAGSDQTESLTADLEAARSDLSDLRTELDRAQSTIATLSEASSTSGGVEPAVKEAVQRVNDEVSQWRNAIEDIAELVEEVQLEAGDAVTKGESWGLLTQSVDDCKRAVGGTKDALRALRRLVQ